MQTDPHSPPLWAAVAAAITAQRSAFHAACNASECALNALQRQAHLEAWDLTISGKALEGIVHFARLDSEAKQGQCKLVRDIFGNPFRPVSINPIWLTPAVVKFAQTVYDGRQFADLPERADALEEAGCTNDDILTHCSQPGEHVRGCWVIDLILGKK